MILSMTGFGRGIASTPDKKITIEIKSLNSKQLDLSMRMPPYFREMEMGMRNNIASALQRGKVEANILIEHISEEASGSINIPVLADYKRQIEESAVSLGIGLPQDWFSILLKMPDALCTPPHIASEEDGIAIMEALSSAIDNLSEFRKSEGAKLYSFFKSKIENIRHLLELTEPIEAHRVDTIRCRIEEQLQKLSMDYDKSRFEQEMIFYIEKLDVTEEKTRLRAHLNYFMETLDAQPGQGKKIGFIAQEMGREINTLGSKSNDADMQRIVVMMKDELEQIKEQVLNVL